MLRGNLFGIAFLTLVLTGCGPPHALFFPQYVQVAGSPVLLARHGAQLVEADGCLWLKTDVSTHLAIWPNTVAPRWNGLNWEIVDPTGHVLAVTGQAIVVGGGELPEVNDLVTVPIPERCAGDGFWKVAGILDD